MYSKSFGVNFQSENFIFKFIPLQYEIEANDDMIYAIEQIIRNTVVIKAKQKLYSMKPE